MKSGTQLAFGNSIATLNKDCTITITGTANQIHTLGEKLEALRTASDSSSMAQKLVELFDAVVGTVDASNDVAVQVTFAE